MDDRLISRKKVMEMLGISNTTYAKLKGAGVLKPVATPIGQARFRESDVRKLVASYEHNEDAS